MLLSSALPAKPLTLEPRQLHSTSSPRLSPFPASISHTCQGGLPFLAMLETASGLPAFQVPTLESKLVKEPME